MKRDSNSHSSQQRSSIFANLLVGNRFRTSTSTHHSEGDDDEGASSTTRGSRSLFFGSFIQGGGGDNEDAEYKQAKEQFMQDILDNDCKETKCHELFDNDDEKFTVSQIQLFTNDATVMLLACQNDGWCLMYGSSKIRNNYDIVLAAVTKCGDVLEYASRQLRNDPNIVWTACQNFDGTYGNPLQYASKQIRNNQDLVLRIVQLNGHAIKYASPKLKRNVDIVLAAVQQDGDVLESISKEFQTKHPRVTLAAVQQMGYALAYAPESLQNDYDIVSAAVQHRGEALRHASDDMKNNFEIVLLAVQQCGYALEYASDELRANKKCVIAAAISKPLALKFALGGLNQNKECLIAAKLWDANYDENNKNPQEDPQNDNETNNHNNNKKHPKIVLSTRFSLSQESSHVATEFAVALKEHPYIQKHNFLVYSPNAHSKDTCDPEWTRMIWPCRGTTATCQKIATKADNGAPLPSCCWRYSFRYQLLEAKQSGGCMVQVVELDQYPSKTHVQGDGQQIESVMAKDIGMKVFRLYEPFSTCGFEPKHMDEFVTKLLQVWYEYQQKQEEPTEDDNPSDNNTGATADDEKDDNLVNPLSDVDHWFDDKPESKWGWP